MKKYDYLRKIIIKKLQTLDLKGFSLLFTDKNVLKAY